MRSADSLSSLLDLSFSVSASPALLKADTWRDLIDSFSPSLQVLSLPPGGCSSHPAALLFFIFHELGTASRSHLPPELAANHFPRTLPSALSFVFSMGAGTLIKHELWLWSLSATYGCHWLPLGLWHPPLSGPASHPFLVSLVSLWTRTILSWLRNFTQLTSLSWVSNP